MLKKDRLTKATTGLGPCRVRSETDRPCLRSAVVEIQGIPFCEPCAREQEAYFEIGELTQPLAIDRTKQAGDFSGGETLVGLLLKRLGRMRRELADRTGQAETKRAKAVVGSPE
jgi:hypothetical protein